MLGRVTVGLTRKGREFLEFSTLLNESAGGVLLAIRKPLRRFFQVSRHLPPRLCFPSW